MQIKFFRIAELAAVRSQHRVKIGAVLVKKGQVLNFGYNKIGKTHPKYPWFLHAELDTCLGTSHRDLAGATVYLYRSNRVGDVLNCRPCPTCVGVLTELGVKSVCYTTGQRVWLEGTGDWETHYLEMRL